MHCPKCSKPLNESHNQCIFHRLYRKISIPQAIAAIVLIIVVIFLAWPSRIIDETRSPLARVHSDQRAMAIALESYFAEHNCYPAWNVDPNRNVFGKTVLEYPAMAKLPTFSLDSGPHPNTLTTPLAYLPAYFADPYAPFKGATFCYWTKNFSESGPGKSGWILWSPGPDKKYDLTLDNIAQIYDPLKPVPSAALLELTYDPSNGSASTGDIWRPNK